MRLPRAARRSGNGFRKRAGPAGIRCASRPRVSLDSIGRDARHAHSDIVWHSRSYAPWPDCASFDGVCGWGMCSIAAPAHLSTALRVRCPLHLCVFRGRCGCGARCVLASFDSAPVHQPLCLCIFRRRADVLSIVPGGDFSMLVATDALLWKGLQSVPREGCGAMRCMRMVQGGPRLLSALLRAASLGGCALVLAAGALPAAGAERRAAGVMFAAGVGRAVGDSGCLEER